MQHKLINTGDYLLIVDESEIKEGDWCISLVEQPFIFQCTEVKVKNYLGGNGGYTFKDKSKKIIAHLPLNNSPILEGVDLLPPLEDEVEKLAKEYGELICNKNGTARFDFKRGYNKSKDKYKYTGQLKDKDGNPIRDGDKIRKITNTDIGIFQGGIVKWVDEEGCFKCGETILYQEYMNDFIIVNLPKQLKEDIIKAQIRVYERYADWNEEVAYDAKNQIEKLKQSLQQPKMAVGFECEMVQKKPKHTDYGVLISFDNEPFTVVNTQGQTVWVGTYIY